MYNHLQIANYPTNRTRILNYVTTPLQDVRNLTTTQLCIDLKCSCSLELASASRTQSFGTRIIFCSSFVAKSVTTVSCAKISGVLRQSIVICARRRKFRIDPRTMSPPAT